MSIQRLLDEATLKGGYNDGYTMLNTMLAGAGFIRDNAIDAARRAQHLAQCGVPLRQLYSTDWTLTQDGWKLPIVLRLVSDGRKSDRFRYTEWYASLLSLKVNRRSHDCAHGETPIEAIEKAFIRARVSGPLTPRVQAFVNALNKLRESPLRAHMEWSLSCEPVGGER